HPALPSFPTRRSSDLRGDLVERLVPRDRREPARALRPDPAERAPDAIGAVDALQVVVDLGAEEALRETVLRVAADRDRAAVLHRSEEHTSELQSRSDL